MIRRQVAFNFLSRRRMRKHAAFLEHASPAYRAVEEHILRAASLTHGATLLHGSRSKPFELMPLHGWRKGMQAEEAIDRALIDPAIDSNNGETGMRQSPEYYGTWAARDERDTDILQEAYDSALKAQREADPIMKDLSRPKERAAILDLVLTLGFALVSNFIGVLVTRLAWPLLWVLQLPLRILGK